MDSPVDAQTMEAIIDRIRGVYGRWNRDTTVEQMRRDWDDLFWSDAVPAATEDAEAEGVPVRWIDAPGADRNRVLVYFHGGGYKMGSVVSHHDLMARLSTTAGCRVLGVDYRRVPEHTFPAPVQDGLAAYRWLLEQDVKPENIALAGDSAGGGMVAAALLALRATGTPLPACAVMLSAWTDLEARAPSYETRAETDPIHQRKIILAVAAQYLGEHGEARDPLASPLHGHLGGLPPLFLQVGDRETGLDDSTLFADKARKAGVETEMEVWDGMIHVFQQFASELPQAREAIEHIGNFLTKHWSDS